MEKIYSNYEEELVKKVVLYAGDFNEEESLTANRGLFLDPECTNAVDGKTLLRLYQTGNLMICDRLENATAYLTPLSASEMGGGIVFVNIPKGDVSISDDEGQTKLAVGLEVLFSKEINEL